MNWFFRMFVRDAFVMQLQTELLELQQKFKALEERERQARWTATFLARANIRKHGELL